jgi:hypothetical protein
MSDALLQERTDALLQERSASHLSVSAILSQKVGQIDSEQSRQLMGALFFAKWSEIRKDTAKALNKYDGPSGMAILASILTEVEGRHSKSGWQKLHGALLGVNAILGGALELKIEGETTSRIKSLCLGLQGHPQLLVREEVYRCLSCLFGRSDPSGRLSLLESMLGTVIKLVSERLFLAEDMGYVKTPSPSSSSSPSKNFNFENVPAAGSPRINSSIEKTAYVLEGTLALIHSVFESTPDLFELLTKSHSSPSSPSSGQQNEAETEAETEAEAEAEAEAVTSVFTSIGSTTSTTRTTNIAGFDQAPFYVAIAGCLGDISSTVRQAAAQALLALLARCDSEKEKEKGEGESAVVKVARTITRDVYTDLTGRLKALSNYRADDGDQSWLELEACLLISEGLLKRRIDSAFTAPALVFGTGNGSGSGSDQINSSSSSSNHLLQYYVALHAALPGCILNPAFEIKRAATQVLPLLARLLCMLSPEAVFTGPLFNCNGSANDNDHDGGDGAHSATSPSALMAVYGFYWLSEVTKASQHMREVVLQQQQPQSQPQSQPQPMWAMEVAGRLGEEESKLRFRQGLCALVAGDTDNGSDADKVAGVLRTHLSIITEGLRTHLPRLLLLWSAALEAQGEDPGALVAIDVAEASALAACAMCSDSSSSSSSGFGAKEVAVDLAVLQAWVQSPQLVPHLLHTTSGRYRGTSSPRGGNNCNNHRMWQTPSGADPVLIIPSVTDPAADPAAHLAPGLYADRRPSQMLAATPRSAHATNRHFCEVIAPVLPVLAAMHSSQATQHSGTATTTTAAATELAASQFMHLLSASQLCAHWLCCCLSDPQFLERRQHVRDGLATALGSFSQTLHALSAAGAGKVDLTRPARKQLLVLEQLLSIATRLLTSSIEMMANGNRGSGGGGSNSSSSSSNSSASTHDALTLGCLALSARQVAMTLDSLGEDPLASDTKDKDDAATDVSAERKQLIEDLSRARALLASSVLGGGSLPSSPTRSSSSSRSCSS